MLWAGSPEHFQTQLGQASVALCVEMGFSWESRCKIEINVWVHFFLLVFEELIDPESSGCLEKAKTTNVGKGCLKLSFILWFTHWWNRLCETDWVGVGKDKTVKPYFKTQWALGGKGVGSIGSAILTISMFISRYVNTKYVAKVV